MSGPMPMLLRALSFLSRTPARIAARRLFNVAYRNEAAAKRSWRGVVPRMDGMLMIAGTVGHLEREILLSGEWEPCVARIIEQVLRPGDLAVDAGANIGCHTLSMARCVGTSGRVLAIEPNPRVLSDLRANIATNALAGVDVIAKAVGDAPGRSALKVPARDDPLAVNQGLSSLAGLHTPSDSVEVEVTTLDAILGEEALRSVSLVKVDVQGFDAKVVRGMRRVLERDHPVVILEYEHWAWQLCGERLDSLVAWMGDIGYSLHSASMRRGRLRLVPLGGPPGPHCDVVALHSSFDRTLLERTP